MQPAARFPLLTYLILLVDLAFLAGLKRCRCGDDVFLTDGMEAEAGPQQEREVLCTSPGEQNSAVADIARSDPVVELAGHGDTDGREKGDDTGEELTDKSDAEEEWEAMEEVHEEEFIKTERIISTDDVVIPQHLPDPERQRDTPPVAVEAGLAEEALVQRVAVEEAEELRDDGVTVIRRLTTMYHIRTEFASPTFRGDEPNKVEKLLGTEVEEQITELAPGVHLPYDDDAEVATTLEEFEDCLPDGTWTKKKVTRTTVQPPPSTISSHVEITTTGAVEAPPDDQTSDLVEKSGLFDSGYPDEVVPDLADEIDEAGSVSQQLESCDSELESRGVILKMSDDLLAGEGMVPLYAR